VRKHPHRTPSDIGMKKSSLSVQLEAAAQLVKVEKGTDAAPFNG